MRAVLSFHSIDDSGSLLSFPPQALRALLDGLRRSGIAIVPLSRLLAANDGPPAVSLSFDDGMASLHQQLLPLMREYDFPAHLFLTTATVGLDNRWPSQPAGAPRFAMLDWRQIEALHDAGMYIDAHTRSHPYLSRLSEQQVVDECASANADIEQRLGQAPRYFAYPYGDYSPAVARAIQPLYRAALTTDMRPLRSRGESLYQLPRIDSYYLRQRWLHHAPGSLRSQYYLRGRGLLRAAKQAATCLFN